MKISVLKIYATVIFIALLVSCENSEQKYVGIEPEQIDAKNYTGEKKIYTPEGKLLTIAQYKDGKVSGKVRKFFNDGNVYMDAIYTNGRKNGLCIYYYENGKPYTVSNYTNGYKEGIEKKYYEEGGLMAEIIYKKNQIQPGLKEFKKDGTPILYKIGITIREINHLNLDGSFGLEASLTDKNFKPVFYIFEQSTPQYKQKMKMANGVGRVDYNISSGGFLLKKLIVEAEFKTTRGNILKIQKNYNLAIDR